MADVLAFQTNGCDNIAGVSSFAVAAVGPTATMCGLAGLLSDAAAVAAAGVCAEGGLSVALTSVLLASEPYMGALLELGLAGGMAP